MRARVWGRSPKMGARRAPPPLAARTSGRVSPTTHWRPTQKLLGFRVKPWCSVVGTLLMHDLPTQAPRGGCRAGLRLRVVSSVYLPCIRPGLALCWPVCWPCTGRCNGLVLALYWPSAVPALALVLALYWPCSGFVLALHWLFALVMASGCPCVACGGTVYVVREPRPLFAGYCEGTL